MAPLTPAAVAAIARLRAFHPPPFSTWDHLSLSRKAAVLILLFADRRGDLRVVLTMRAASLRSYSGQAAFPGGKADTLDEDPFDIARREAYEEIGLPRDDSKIPSPFRIEHLCQLPFSCARTALARVVAAVFTARFHNFLREEDEVHEGEDVPGSRSDWYRGAWVDFNHSRWRMHEFYVPINHQLVTKPKVREGGQAAIAESLDEDEGKDEAGTMRYKVWGMTARILVDAARVAYGEEPEFAHNTHFGDEAMIEKLYKMNRFGEKVPGGLTDADIQAARARVAQTKI
ncbi:hypothetical protein LZ554_002435 [Drepanopeziza brunnea f. sp. 'monogermtubi']|nr:hypothetical protein LZ554_002435 [Drepanopeziza brunnea f. sp. 'monogermtubi']